MKTYPPRTQESSILGVWTASGAPKTIPKGGVRSPPPFGMVSGAPGAIQTRKIDDFWVLGVVGLHDYIDTKLGLVWTDQKQVPRLPKQKAVAS